PEDFRHLSAERSNSPLDRRHRLTLNWLYEMPYLSHSKSWAVKNLIGNWSFVGTYTAESGEWTTAQSGGDANLNGDNAGDRTILNPAGDPKLGSPVTALCQGGPCSRYPAAQRPNFTVAYLANTPN